MKKKQKYIMLFNFDRDGEGLAMMEYLSDMFPNVMIHEYGVSKPFEEPEYDYTMSSVWIPKKQFLAAWMFVNLLRAENYKNEYVKEFLVEFTISDAIRYMENHLNEPDLYVKRYWIE